MAQAISLPGTPNLSRDQTQGTNEEFLSAFESLTATGCPGTRSATPTAYIIARSPPSRLGICRLVVRGLIRDREMGSTTTQRQKGCHVCDPSTSGRHFLSPRLCPQLGRHPLAELLRPRRPSRSADRRFVDRRRRRAASQGLAVEPLAGQLDLVRARTRRTPVSQVRINWAEHRPRRTRSAYRRVQRLVQPAGGDCNKHRQSPQL